MINGSLESLSYSKPGLATIGETSTRRVARSKYRVAKLQAMRQPKELSIKLARPTPS
jgi:hypothetical protein